MLELPHIGGVFMRNILLFAAAVLVVGGYMAKVADKAVDAPRTLNVAPPSKASVKQSKSGPQSVTLWSDRQGHFPVEALVQDRRVDFIVDSGASLVTLRRSAAKAVGIDPGPSSYTATVSTANGNVRAAPVRLNELSIGGITIYDVNALVISDQALGVNLLGVSFLSRLRRYEFANGRMVLEQ